MSKKKYLVISLGTKMSGHKYYCPLDNHNLCDILGRYNSIYGIHDTKKQAKEQAIKISSEYNIELQIEEKSIV